MMPEVSGSVANAVHPSSSQSKTAHTRSSDGVLTAHHDTSFGPARRRGHRLRDHRRPRHAWDLSTSVGRTIDFPAETITTMPDVVALTCTDHTVELGLVKAAYRAARQRHRHRTADGHRRSHHPPLTARPGIGACKRPAPSVSSATGATRMVRRGAHVTEVRAFLGDSSSQAAERHVGATQRRMDDLTLLRSLDLFFSTTR